MAERDDSNLLRVLIGQVSEDSEINIVISKALRVLGHAELFEPFCNLLHRGTPFHPPCVLPGEDIRVRGPARS
jgi:hypothetical protein